MGYIYVDLLYIEKVVPVPISCSKLLSFAFHIESLFTVNR